MSKLIRSALLITLTYAFTQCGAASGDATQDPGVSSAGQSGSGAHAGAAGSNTDSSGGSGGVAQGGSASAGDSAISHVGGMAGGGGAAAAGAAGVAGAAGAVSGLGCGATCGPSQYCRAPCSGVGFGFGGTTGLPIAPPLPSCAPLPAACNGTPTCDCICGPGSAQWCSTGSKPITTGPAVQCGCG